jgi:phosphoglucomutase
MSNAQDAPVKIGPLAGKLATLAMLVDVPRLVTAYYTDVPDASVPEQRVAFGTSGHRGSAFANTFNEWHILAISQAICDYRKRQGIGGPLFLGIDTHALSVPACASALEVLAANGVEVMLADKDEYTPTPAISHAILAYNRGRGTGPVLSSRRRTIRRTMAASSTTRPTAGRQIPTSPDGSKSEPMRFWTAASRA